MVFKKLLVLVLLAVCVLIASGAAHISARADSPVAAAISPVPGEWDGVTASAHLSTPYEDLAMANVPFGITSYYMQPWRSYMDTWPAAWYRQCPGVNWTIRSKYADATCQILHECGIRTVRYEIPWAYLGWNDELQANAKARIEADFVTFRKYGIRPMILLNANHGAPCPMRPVDVVVQVPALKGGRILKLAPATKIRVAYTGLYSPRGIAAYPLITSVDADGTAHLSAPLEADVPVGRLHLIELKYQPFQGDHLADGTPVPACQETYDGWMKYVATIAAEAKQALGTAGGPDAGFDFEVWNEQTFGANFLHIFTYYDPPIKYETYGHARTIYVYKKTRPLQPTFRPDAQIDFSSENCYAILPMTIDYIHDHAADYPGVHVEDGFSNQWPWDSGTSLWPGQCGFSRHYYTGGAWLDSSPQHPLNGNVDGTKEYAVMNALGKVDGTPDAKNGSLIMPGTAFVPTMRIGFPEYWHSGFKTESLTRDVAPDSRYTYFSGHGRYTNNGDFQTAQVWQTEVNFNRAGLWRQIKSEGGYDPADPKALALDEHLNAKYMLRQYLFHNHKGLSRIYLFLLAADPYSYGMLPKRYFDALDKSNGVLTPDVRANVPEGFAGLAWLSKQMDSGEPIDAPRPLRVDDLIEYKPRLVMKGDGTPAHPDTYNRDWFAFLPYQLSPSKYIIPYYVITTDLSHEWDKSKPLLDPARWDMPVQGYDVMIGNIDGTGVTVSAFDPITMAAVPAKVISRGSNNVMVHVSAVDYPRFLTITQPLPGPQILHPRASLTSDDRVNVSWKLNMPANVTVTYGSDWENRSMQQIAVAKGTSSITLPYGMKGVVAVRIKATTRDLVSDVWPRWDEDPQGQIVVPGGTVKAPASVAEPLPPPPTGMPVALVAPTGVQLKGRLVQPNWISMAFPLTEFSGETGSGNDYDILFKHSNLPLDVHLIYVTGGAASPETYLPLTATTDDVSETAVMLPSGVTGTLYDYSMTAAAHPGMTNLRQRWLLIPTGRKDANLVIAAISAQRDVMQAEKDTIQAMLASISLPAAKP